MHDLIIALGVFALWFGRGLLYLVWFISMPIDFLRGLANGTSHWNDIEIDVDLNVIGVIILTSLISLLVIIFAGLLYLYIKSKKLKESNKPMSREQKAK